MGKVSTGFSMSLDGFVAGPNDSHEQPFGVGGDRLFAWMSIGQTETKITTGDTEFMVNEEATDMYEATKAVGALVYGRRTFDLARAWGGKHPLNVPMVIVTHNPPQEWVNKPDSPFTFVTDGVASAIAQAQKIAGEKMIAIGSPSVLQQAIQLGLLDEIHIDLVPLLLGSGVRMFDHLGKTPLELEVTNVSAGSGVTHLDYRVIK